MRFWCGACGRLQQGTYLNFFVCDLHGRYEFICPECVKAVMSEAEDDS